MSEEDKDRKVTWKDLEDMFIEDNPEFNWVDKLRVQEGHYKREMSKEQLDFLLDIMNYLIYDSYDQKEIN